ncbi:hypothetical protein Hamer_G001114 [Homarus americanus]|uniref:Uncharacterized protein n=1 Tax=Homarus americanus TaxID=6706 RepID=A0A8J5N2U3_HOMAM|nr:hypothetical protein Hamer_G001114 [Homarus americanus]
MEWHFSLLLLALTSLAASMSQTKDYLPNVAYISSKELGDFLVADKTTLAYWEESLNTANVRTLCGCRTACWSSRWCVAASLDTTSDGVLCRLARLTETNLPQTTKQTNSTYIFFLSKSWC